MSNKPIGSSVCWSTGVGKTETCKQVAESLNIKLLKYDNEYLRKIQTKINCAPMDT